MTPEVLAQIKTNLKLYEGCTNWLYLDSRGIPTCGVGHAVRTLQLAEMLPFSPRISIEEWTRLMNAPKKLRAEAYQLDTAGRLSDEAVDQLLNMDVEKTLLQISHAIPGFGALPGPAQIALFDMGYNLGVAGLLKYCEMLAAVKGGNWEEAARQCYRNGVSPERNQATAALLRECAE